MMVDDEASANKRTKQGAAVKIAALLLVLAMSIVAGLLIYRSLLEPRGPFLWDEAVHALKGLLIAHDLRQGEVFAFLLDSYRQVLYPPVHSWLLATIFLVADPSPVSAGLLGIACYVATALILFMSATYLCDRETTIGGIGAALLFLASPLLIQFVPQTMLEIPGLAALSLTILIYLRLLHRNVPAWQYVFLGLGIVLTYFVRMPYGVRSAVAILLYQLIDVRFNVLALFNRRNIWLLAPVILIFAGWFAYPAKLTSTWTWLVNYPNIEAPYSAQGWLFYPRATVRMAGSLWMFAFLFASLVYGLVRHHRDRRVRLLLIIVFTQFLIGELYHNKQDRYLFPMLPPIYMLAGFTLAELWQRYKDPQHLVRFWLPRVLTVVILLHAGMIFRDALQQEPLGRSAAADNAKQIAQIVADNGTALVIGTMDIVNPSPPLLDWYLVTQAHLVEAPQGGASAQIEEERKIQSLLLRLPLPSWLTAPIQSQMARYDQSGGTRTLYLGLPRRASYSQSREGFDAFFQESLREGAFDSVVIVTSTRPQAEFPLDYVAPSLESAALEHTVNHILEDSRLRIDVYR